MSRKSVKKVVIAKICCLINIFATSIQASEVYPIIHYLPKHDKDYVLIEVEPDSSLAQGTLLKTYRKSYDPNALIWIETGSLRVIERQESRALAEVVQSGTLQSQNMFPKFPEIMAGDLAKTPRQEVARITAVTPTVELRYNEIFVDPAADPTTFEIGLDGQKLLEERMRAFAGAKLGMLLIEGFTDTEGSRNANQIESYQRALTVRQYLIDRLGFDKTRVIAVGQGEGELADTTNTDDHRDNNRRVVIKAVAQVQGI